MTDGVEWYIARDGKQHGPLSAVEMQKFVELGHLKATDLVWCADFADWRNGHEVFQVAVAPPAAPVPPAQNRQPPPRTDHPHASGDHQAEAGAAAPSARSVRGTAQQHAPSAAQFRHDTQPGMRAPAAANGANPGAHAYADRAPQFDPRQPQPAGRRELRPQMGPQGQGPRLAPAPFPAMPDPPTNHRRGQHPSSVAHDQWADDDEAEPKSPRRRWLWTIAAILALVSLAALAWFGFQYLGPSNSLVTARSVIDGQVKAALSSLFDDPASFKASPFAVNGTDAGQIDHDLQTRALWRLLKADYPDWYASTLADITKMKAAGQPDDAVANAMAKLIVSLRRDNSKHALAATSDSFLHMSRLFVTNLKALSTVDSKVCYEYISFGEGGSSVISAAANPAVTEPLHRQLVAIFAAVRDCRASPKAYGTAIREDYDALSKHLTDKHGWRPDDLQVFSNPQLLAQAPPDRVCAMVQDWFTAQINLPDHALRSRLLFESLRPLVAG